jgi:hypothetical protein
LKKTLITSSVYADPKKKIKLQKMPSEDFDRAIYHYNYESH